MGAFANYEDTDNYFTNYQKEQIANVLGVNVENINTNNDTWQTGEFTVTDEDGNVSNFVAYSYIEMYERWCEYWEAEFREKVYNDKAEISERFDYLLADDDSEESFLERLEEELTNINK